MADLELQIVATAGKAVNAISQLETSLKGLSQSLQQLNTGGMGQLAGTIKNLSSAVGTFKGVSAKDFNKLENGLSKLAKIDTSKFSVIATDLSTLANSLRQFGGTNVDKSMINLVNAFNRLAGVNLSALTSADFTNFTTQITNLATALSQAPQINRNIIVLIDALSRFGSAGGNVAVASSALPGLATNLREFFRVMASATQVSAETTQLVQALAQLASSGAKAATTADNLQKLGTELKSLITTLSQAPEVSQNTIGLVQALAQLASSGGHASLSTGQLHTSIRRLPSAMNHARRSTKGLVSSIGMFYAKCFLLIRALKGVWKAVNSAMDFVEVYNYFNAALNNVADKAVDNWQEMGYSSAEAYYDSFKERSLELTKKMTGYTVGANGELESAGIKNLGIDPSVMLNYQATFAQMASSMGVASEDALLLSKGLTMLGADLASIKNEKFEDTWKSMASGMVGMSRAVDRYGLNIRNAAMQEKLEALGINAKVNALSQADKALLRTIIMVENSRYAWGDLANTLEQPKNQIRMLEASWASMCRTMGTLFMGAVSKIIPYINVLLIALTRLFQYIGKLFGIEIPTISSQATGGMADLGGAIDDVGDALDDANGSAKKLKSNLLGIDELNVINSDSDSGSGKGLGLGGIGGALSDALKGILDDYDKVWNDAYNRLKDKVAKWVDNLIDYFRRGDYYGLGKAIADWLTKALASIDWNVVYAYAEKFGKALAEFFNGLIQPELFYQLGRTMAGLLMTAFHFVGAFVREFDWKKAGLSLAMMVNGFLDELDPVYIAETISIAIKGALTMVAEFLRDADWEQLGRKVMDFLCAIDWVGILSGVWDVIVAALGVLMKTWKGSFDAHPIATALLTAIANGILFIKGAMIFDALSKVLLKAAEANAIGTGLGSQIFGGISKAFVSMGGLSGLLLTDVEVLGASGGFYEIGLIAGTAVVGGIAAAIAGFSIGTAIYEAFIEDTEYDAFGYDAGKLVDDFYKDLYNKELIADAEQGWNSALKELATKLDWGALFDFNTDENKDIWAGVINEMDTALSQISTLGYNLSDTSLVIGLLDDNTLGLSTTTRNYIRDLVDQYDSLDDNTKMILALKYGFTDLQDSMGEAEFEIQKMSTELYLAENAERDFIRANEEEQLKLAEQSRAVDATREAVNQYALAHGASIEQIANFNSAIEGTKNVLYTLREGFEITSLTQKNAVEATMSAVAAYAEAHGATQEYINKLKGIVDQENETSSATDGLTDDYSGLMKAFENSSLTASDFSTYMETLSGVDIPNATEGISEFNNSITGLQTSLPSLKDTFDTTFEPFNDLTNEVIPNVETGLTTMRTNIATQMPLLEQSITNVMTNVKTKFDEVATRISTQLPITEQEFATTIENIKGKLEEVKLWWDENIGVAFEDGYWAEKLAPMEEEFKNVAKNICNGIIEIVNLMIDKINEGMVMETSDLEIGGKQVMTAGKKELLKFQHIEGFAQGGFPDKGLFMMNEGDRAEMVGSINGRTAVVNNDQIVQAVSQGVYQAVSSAMSNNENNVNVYLQGDAQGLFKVVREQNRIFTRQTGQNAFV